MTPKMETPVKAAKEVGGDVPAWETRLKYLQNEAETLKARNGQIRQEIESALALAQAELDKRRAEARAESAKVTEEAAKLQTDRAEFETILRAYKEDKAAFVAQQIKANDLALDAERAREKVNNFLVMIHREAAKL